MYQLIYLPIIATILAQIIKMIINGIKGEFTWKDLNSYGGMPSSHTALVTALAAAIGFYQGWDSAAFAISVILAVIVIRDAAGFRRILGKHAFELNQIIHTLRPENNYKFQHLRERLGHTPLEILAGMALGILVVTLYIILF